MHQAYGRGLGVAVVLACVVGLLGAAPASAAGLDLHRWSRGSEVRLLERRLNELAFLPRTAVDRRYRMRTVYAVKRFQRAHALPVTGSTDQRTWDSVYYAMLRSRSAPPVILAHRGAGVPSVPENTMASMRYALHSADVLEFDVRRTADGALVLMHDRTLDRTTNCSGALALKTFKELRAQCTVSGEPIPTLDEVVAFAAANAVSIAPELKEAALTDGDLARFADVIRSHGLTRRAFVQSFHPSLFPRLRALDADLAFVYLTGPGTSPDVVASAGVAIAGLNRSGLTRSIVTAYHRAGLQVWAWTAYTTTDLASVWQMRVNGVFTDVPVAAHALFATS